MQVLQNTIMPCAGARLTQRYMHFGLDVRYILGTLINFTFSMEKHHTIYLVFLNFSFAFHPYRR